jgi:GntR family transcriptional regulator
VTNFRNIYSSDLSHRARSVYMYLKDRADKDDKCWPAIKTIAKELGLSSSTVKRALDELCQAGLLTKESRWRENGGRTSNLLTKTDPPPPGGESANLVNWGLVHGEPTRSAHSKIFLRQRKKQILQIYFLIQSMKVDTFSRSSSLSLVISS